jgi:hypothetical protein
MNADGTGQTRLSPATDHPVDDWGPAWSPDGTRIAFTRDVTGDDTNGDYDVYVMDADGTDVTQLTDAAGNDADPAWSPGGTRIVFSSTRDGGVNDEELYLMDADGTNEARLITTAGRDTYPDWQPVDTVDPLVTITTPPGGAVYERGTAVTADFGCTDADTVVVACFGPVVDGAMVDTSTTGVHTFTVTGVDRMHNTATATSSYTVVRHQPDERIRRGVTGAYTADDVYNTTGAGQARTASVGALGSATFYALVQNDGTVPDTFRLRGGASTSRFAVRYFVAGVDRTGAITAGTYATSILTPGASVVVRVVVTARVGTPRGAGVSRLLTATSVAQPAAEDAVKATVTRS